MTDGNIIYVSESVTSLLEHLPVSMNTLHLFDQNYIEISNFVKHYYNLKLKKKKKIATFN